MIKLTRLHLIKKTYERAVQILVYTYDSVHESTKLHEIPSGMCTSLASQPFIPPKLKFPSSGSCTSLTYFSRKYRESCSASYIIFLAYSSFGWNRYFIWRFTLAFWNYINLLVHSRFVV